jgi:hypothetical protein
VCECSSTGPFEQAMQPESNRLCIYVLDGDGLVRNAGVGFLAHEKVALGWNDSSTRKVCINMYPEHVRGPMYEIRSFAVPVISYAPHTVYHFLCTLEEARRLR